MRGDFVELFIGGLTRKFEANGRRVRSHGDDGTVARVGDRRVGESVERLLGAREIVDAKDEQDIGADGFAADEEAASAIALIGFGKDAAEAQASFGEWRAGGETLSLITSLVERADKTFRNGVNQPVGLVGGSDFLRII